MKKLLLLAAAAVVGSAAFAQADRDIQSYSGPVTHVGTFHVATGTWTYAQPASGADGASTVCYDNGSGALSATTSPNTTQLGKEYVDWGTYAPCGAFGTNTMTQFTIGWCANMTNPVGANIEVAFYSGTNPTVGGPYGVKGTLIQKYVIGPLGGSSVAGQLQAFTANVDISGSPLTIPTGPIGWSYRIPTAITGTGGTGFGWLMIPVASSGAGNVDLFDRYLANGTFEGTLSFTTVGIASFYMKMWMDNNPPPCAGGTSEYGQGSGGTINKGDLTVGGTGKIGGNAIMACKNPQTANANTKAIAYFSLAPANLAVLDGVVLIDPAFFQLDGPKNFPSIPGSVVTFNEPIPNDVSLIDVHVYGQALYYNFTHVEPLRLTDGAIDIHIHNCP
ncbi:MAG: hypothetical protein EPO68_00035 [Planctomycetota bacterium]|nr:MAG: hypothetical protein EPO68_00035 [Planctomycetota bacterium]